MLKRLLRRWHRSYNYFGKWSQHNFIKYLREYNVKIGDKVIFRYPKSTTIDLNRPELIEIGDNVDINANFTIMTHDFATYVFRNLYGDFVAGYGKVKIGSNIYIGRDVTICRGGEIGDNTVVGIGSVVMKKMPPNSVIAGTPAKVICSIEDYYRKRKIAQIAEFKENVIAFFERYGRLPTIMDLKEEWCMFITKEDLEKYPEVHSLIDWRLRDKYELFFNKHIQNHIGFDKFINSVLFQDDENISNNTYI